MFVCFVLVIFWQRINLANLQRPVQPVQERVSGNQETAASRIILSEISVFKFVETYAYVQLYEALILTLPVMQKQCITVRECLSIFLWACHATYLIIVRI